MRHASCGDRRVFRQLQELQGGRRPAPLHSRCPGAAGPDSLCPCQVLSLCTSSVTVATLGAIGFCRGDSGGNPDVGKSSPSPSLPRTPPGVWCAEFTLQQIREGGADPATQGAGVYPSVGSQSCALNVTLCIVWRVVERKSVT